MDAQRVRERRAFSAGWKVRMPSVYSGGGRFEVVDVVVTLVFVNGSK